MKIKIKYLPEAKRMEKITRGNWIDVYAYQDTFVPEGERAMINLGFALELPKGWEGHLAPRSSTFKTWGVIQTNHVGVVDDTYIGDNDIWMMPVYCLRGNTIITKEGIEIVDVKQINIDKYEGYNHEGECIYFGNTSPRGFCDWRQGTWIRKGDKIGQFRIMEVMPEIELEEVESFGNDDRGGFGTTGTN